MRRLPYKQKCDLPRGFDRNSFDEFFNDLIIQGGLRPTIPESVPGNFRLLLEKCWAADPKARPTASDLVIELEKLYQEEKAKEEAKEEKTGTHGVSIGQNSSTLLPPPPPNPRKRKVDGLYTASERSLLPTLKLVDYPGKSL